MSDLDFEILNFSELKDSLSQAYGEFRDYVSTEENVSIRSFDESLLVLEALEKMATSVQSFLRGRSYFLTLFEKDWGSYKSFNDRDYIYELCFIEKFLFPKTQNCPLESEGVFDQALLSPYHDGLTEWIETVKLNHNDAQEQIHEHFSESLSSQRLPCQCIKCTGDFRSLFREFIFKKIKAHISQAVDDFKGLTYESKREEFIDIFQFLKKNIDKELHKAKSNLRRGTVNKLKTQIDSIFLTHFGYESELLAVYRKKLDEIVTQELVSRGLRKDLVDDGQKSRFFRQRGKGIWKYDRALSLEIHRFIQTVLALKRKDISAKILQDYLGQFWIHTEARKMQRKIIYHMGPTNSGKTYHAIQNLAKVKRGCYLAPLRLLATELYDTLNEMGVKTTLLTGEEVIDLPDATHFSSTIEMVKLHEIFDMCVIDEIQMINDPQRGWAWTRALVSVQAPEVHICGDPTAYELVKKICELCGDELEVREYERMTDLKILPHKIKPNELQKHDAVIVFSRRNALRFKIDLEGLGYKVSIVYGRLSPEVRREQARKFDEGETDIIVSTDAISMGMNLPIKRVVFTTLSKFIDSKEIPISSSEIKQISGRAGRYKRFPTGFVSTLERIEGGIERVREAMAQKAPQKDFAMVGPDLDIFAKVNNALKVNSLPELSLSEFLRLFNTMQFEYPFYCVELKEMIEITEMVEESNMKEKALSDAELFGFSCAPVNMGLPKHIQFFLSIVGRYVQQISISYNKIDYRSEDIDYLETSIKCLELYQWLSRHFNNKNFDYSEEELLHNKSSAIEKLNSLLSEKITLNCVVCGCKLPLKHEHTVCEECFKKRRFQRRRPRSSSSRRPEAHQGEGRGQKKKSQSRRRGFGRNPKT